MAGDPEGLYASIGFALIGGDLAEQVDLISDTNPGIARAHFWESESARFVLTCGTDLLYDRSWVSMAESVELLEGGPEPVPEPTPGSVDDVDTDFVETQDEDLRMGDDPAYFERVEVAEAGVAVAFPPDWSVDIEMEYEENVPGDPETGYWRVLYADGGEEGWCDLTRNLHPVGEVSSLASVAADDFVEDQGGDATAPTTPVELAAGDAWRVDVQATEAAEFTAAYIVDPPAGHLGEPSRFILVCQADERDPRDWLDVADTLEWLDGDVDQEPDESGLFDPDAFGLERVEFAEAGVSVALPPDWSVELQLEEKEDSLPDAYADAGPIDFVDLMMAESDTGEWCQLSAHPENPMPLHDHASWDLAQWSVLFPDLTFDLYSVEDGGETRYIVVGRGSDSDEAANLYFFESAGERYQLNCTGLFGPDSPWDAIAASVEPLGAVPPGVPDDAVAWSELTDIVTALPVSDMNVGEAIMTARCERALWIEHADGWFEERLECVLIDEPVDPPEYQGGLPQEQLPIYGHECEWTSDFWAQTDGSDVWATSWSVTIESDGRASAASWYAPEGLECGD